MLDMVFDCNIRENEGTAIVVKTATMASVTISSSKVNPLAFFFRSRLRVPGIVNLQQCFSIRTRCGTVRQHAQQIREAQSGDSFKCNVRILFVYYRDRVNKTYEDKDNCVAATLTKIVYI